MLRSAPGVRLALLAALWLVSAAPPAVAQGQEVHGADSVFTSPTVSIAWAVLKDPVEERSLVLTRIVNSAGRYAYVSVEGVDPFTGRRALIVEGVPLERQADLRSQRGSFADHPRREFHFYLTGDDWRARKPALTVYYLGVPDTTPEFTSESQALSYLSGALARPR